MRLFILILAAACPATVAAAADRPNVVVILSDDQGWGDLSVHGNANIATPAVDSLARDAGTIGYEVLTSLGRRYVRLENPA